MGMKFSIVSRGSISTAVPITAPLIALAAFPNLLIKIEARLTGQLAHVVLWSEHQALTAEPVLLKLPTLATPAACRMAMSPLRKRVRPRVIRWEPDPLLLRHGPELRRK